MKTRGEPPLPILQPMTVTTVALAIATSLLLIPLLVRIPYHVVINYNEGWNAHHALLAAKGENIYTAGEALIQNNYPPLSFYIVAALAVPLGDELMAGRWIALLSLFWTAVNIGLAIHATSRARVASIFGALFFMACMAGPFEVYVGMNDPQMLAHGLMTTAIVLLVRAGDRARPGVGSPLFMALAGMVKHNLVAFPLAATAYMGLQGGRPFLRWLGLCLGLGLAVWIPVLFLFGPAFLTSTLTAREYSTAKILIGLGGYLPLLLPPLAVWGLGVFRAPRAAEDRLLMLYLFFSAVTGFFFYGGEGVSVNALFDLVIALSWAAGVGLARLDACTPSATHRSTVALWAASLTLVVTVLPPLPERVATWKNLLKDLSRQEAETLSDIQYLKAFQGPMVCTTLGLSYWAGKAFDYDPFNVWQAVQTGRMDEEAVFSRIRRHDYSVIQLESVSRGGLEDFRTRMLLEVEKHYVLDRESPYGYFFIPRTPHGAAESKTDKNLLPPDAEVRKSCRSHRQYALLGSPRADS